MKRHEPPTVLQTAILRAACGALAVVVGILAYTVILFNFVRWITGA